MADADDNPEVVFVSSSTSSSGGVKSTQAISTVREILSNCAPLSNSKSMWMIDGRTGCRHLAHGVGDLPPALPPPGPAPRLLSANPAPVAPSKETSNFLDELLRPARKVRRGEYGILVAQNKELHNKLKAQKESFCRERSELATKLRLYYEQVEGRIIGLEKDKAELTTLVASLRQEKGELEEKLDKMREEVVMLQEKVEDVVERLSNNGRGSIPDVTVPEEVDQEGQGEPFSLPMEDVIEELLNKFNELTGDKGQGKDAATGSKESNEDLGGTSNKSNIAEAEGGQIATGKRKRGPKKGERQSKKQRKVKSSKKVLHQKNDKSLSNSDTPAVASAITPAQRSHLSRIRAVSKRIAKKSKLRAATSCPATPRGFPLKLRLRQRPAVRSSEGQDVPPPIQNKRRLRTLRKRLTQVSYCEMEENTECESNENENLEESGTEEPAESGPPTLTAEIPFADSDDSDDSTGIDVPSESTPPPPPSHGMATPKDASVKTGFLCLCGKRYTIQRNLHRHIRSRLNPKSFQCHLCPVGFPERYRLKAHLKLLHNITCEVEKKRACNFCAQSFESQQALNQHQKTAHSFDIFPFNRNAALSAAVSKRLESTLAFRRSPSPAVSEVEVVWCGSRRSSETATGIPQRNFILPRPLL